jgi:hypothetical protein
MPRYIHSCVLPSRVVLVLASLLAASIADGAVRAAGADNCLEKPNLQATEGGHWYYRVDRPTHRKCWYQAGSGTRVASAAARQVPQQAKPSPSASQPPRIIAWLSEIAASVTGANSSAANSSAASSSAASSSASVTGAASVKGEEDATTRDASVDQVTPRVGRWRTTKGLKSKELPIQRFAEQSPLELRYWPEAEVTTPPPTPSDPEYREALYQEFLRWQERRSIKPW